VPIQSVIRLIRFFRIRAPLSASAASAGEFAGAGAGGNNSGATIPYSTSALGAKRICIAAKRC